MTTWFVSRHAGAVQWAARQALLIDKLVDHLDVDLVQADDTVVGTLPVNLAGQVCARGARYLHLSMEVPAEHRGSELTADKMCEFGARLIGYRVSRVTDLT